MSEMFPSYTYFLQAHCIAVKNTVYSKCPSVSVHAVRVCAHRSVQLRVSNIVPQNRWWYPEAVLLTVRKRSNKKKMNIAPLIWLPALVQQRFPCFIRTVIVVRAWA